MLTFKPLSFDDKQIYERFISGKEVNSEASFANMYAWRQTMKTMFAFDEDNCYFLYTKHNGKIACCFPRGKNIFKGINNLRDFFDENSCSFIMESVTQEEAEYIKLNFPDLYICEDEDVFDYVYKTEKLASLSGKKLHSKRNHINKFKALYTNYEYKKIQADDADALYNQAKKWLLNKYNDCDCVDYKAEITAIGEFLYNFDKFSLNGGILSVNEQIVAFAIGEKLTEDMCVVHIEKADTSFEGAYTMINNLYAINNCKDFIYINREEDMGIFGLRKAKRSYLPDLMIKKYIIEFKGDVD